jgi:tight adherence protein C
VIAAGLTGVAVLVVGWPPRLQRARLPSAAGQPDPAWPDRRAVVEVPVAWLAAVRRRGSVICRFVGRSTRHVGRVVCPSSLVRSSWADDPRLDERVGAALLAALGAAWLAPVLAVPAAGFAIGLPTWRARNRRRRRELRMVDELPAVVELFRLAVGAGLSVHQAVAAVARRTSGEIGRGLAEVVAREAMGERLADGLERFGRLDDAVRPLAAALVAAERYGAALGPSLDRVAVDARSIRRRQAEQVARRLPVQMLFPLVGCILPAFGLLTVVPLLAASLPRLST